MMINRSVGKRDGIINVYLEMLIVLGDCHSKAIKVEEMFLMTSELGVSKVLA